MNSQKMLASDKALANWDFTPQQLSRVCGLWGIIFTTQVNLASIEFLNF